MSTFVEGKFFHLSLIFQSVGIFFDGVPIFWRQFVRESILTKTSVFLSGWFALLVAARLISLDVDMTQTTSLGFISFCSGGLNEQGRGISKLTDCK